MSSLEDLSIEERVAYLEERMDQTAGRLHAALEVLELTFAVVFEESTIGERGSILERVIEACPPDASGYYRECLRAVAGRLIDPPLPD